MKVAAESAVASVEMATAQTGMDLPARKKSSPASFLRDTTAPTRITITM